MYRLLGFFLFTFAILPGGIAAESLDDFTNNLFTDLAPILALFGERVTTQFMSQALGWSDCIVIAMAPLGIVTIIVSAIRVGGPRFLKAIIGRARENISVAEMELMSSTSEEICEMYNGESIVRCQGSAPVWEYICVVPKDLKRGPHVNVEFTTLQEAVNGNNNGKAKLKQTHGPTTMINRTAASKSIQDKIGSSALQEHNQQHQSEQQQETHKWYHANGLAGLRGLLSSLTRADDIEAGPYIEHQATQQKSTHGHSFSSSQVPLTSAACDFGIAAEVHSEQILRDPIDDEAIGNEGGDGSGGEANGSPKSEQTITIIHDLRKDAPNLCLNLQYSPSRHDIHFAACAGVIIQTGILIFFGIMVLHPTARDLFTKNDGNVSRLAFVMSFIGSILLSLGIMFCAHVVESSTQEECYEPVEGMEVHMFWIQRKQTVGDQVFDSYALSPEQCVRKITMSRRNLNSRKLSTIFNESSTWRTIKRVHKKCSSFLLRFRPQLFHPEGDGTTPKQSTKRLITEKLAMHKFLKSLKNSTALNAQTTLGTILTMSGFVLQFVGLRAMNSYASLAQLAAIGVMTIWRTWLRRGLANDFKRIKLRPGYELDWLAWEISRRWFSSDGGTSSSSEVKNDELPFPGGRTENSIQMEVLEPSSSTKGAASSELLEVLDSSPFEEDVNESYESPGQWLPVTAQRRLSNISNSSSHELPDSELKAQQILYVRTELGKLVRARGRVGAEAVNLAQAIELVMNEFFPIKSGSNHNEPLTWPIEITPHRSLSQGYSTIEVELTPKETHWQVRADVLHAVLSLWTYSVSSIERDSKKEEVSRDDAWIRSAVMPKCLRLFGPACEYQREQLREDVLCWIPWREGQMLEACEYQESSESEEESSESEEEAYDSEDHLSLKAPDDASDAIPNAKSDGDDDEDDLNDDEKDYDGQFYVNSRHTYDSSDAEVEDDSDDSDDSDDPLAEEEDWDSESDDSDVEHGTDVECGTFHWTRVVGHTSQEISESTTSDDGFGDFRLYQGSQDSILSDGERGPSRMLAVESSVSLETLYARHLLFSFVTWAARRLPYTLQDRTEIREEAARGRPLQISDRGLAGLAKEIGELDMGTETEVQLGIITPLSLAGKLPLPGALFETVFGRIQKEASSARRDQRWHDLSVTFRRLHQNVKIWGNHRTRIGASVVVFVATHHKLHRDEQELRKLFPEYYRSPKKYESLLSEFENWAEHSPSDLETIQNHHRTTAQPSSGSSSERKYGLSAYPLGYLDNTTELHRLSIDCGCDAGDSIEKMEEACKSIDCKSRDMYGWTPLHYAVINSNVQAVCLLLERGADLRQTDLMGYTAIHYPRDFLAKAISQRENSLRSLSANEADSLLEEVHGCLGTQGVDGQTPMHRAAENGDVASLLALIELLPKTDQDDGLTKSMKEDHLGHNPLHKAALYGQAQALRELAKKKGDIVNKVSARDWSLLQLVMMQNIVHDRQGTFDAIMELSPNIDHKNGHGQTALMLACCKQRWDLALLLIESGADLSAADKDGLTALHHSAGRRGDSSTMFLLLDKGAEVNAEDKHGHTPLYHAVSAARSKRNDDENEKVMELLRRGATPNVNSNIDSPLHLAADRGNERIIKALLDHGADVNAVKRGGKTPLHQAVIPGKAVAVVRMLIESGANVNALTDESLTPLHIATEKGKPSVVKLLLDHGADAYEETASGHIPHEIAITKKRDQIAEMLPSRF